MEESDLSQVIAELKREYLEKLSNAINEYLNAKRKYANGFEFTSLKGKDNEVKYVVTGIVPYNPSADNVSRFYLTYTCLAEEVWGTNEVLIPEFAIDRLNENNARNTTSHT